MDRGNVPLTDIALASATGQFIEVPLLNIPPFSESDTWASVDFYIKKKSNPISKSIKV